MQSAAAEQVIALAARMGIVRARDVAALGIAPACLSRLVQKGALRRVGRGLYVLAEAEPSQHQSLAEVAKRVPHGVVCLLSALQFHELTTQAPFEVWLAIPRGSWRPTIAYPPLRVLRFSRESWQAGVEVHVIEGVEVKVYCPPKTVADCFKYRNKFGLDVAIEALRDCREQRKCRPADLWRFAQICRVGSVMRPYLEAML
jgi:predicted transcriptional regulator of viral defense system